MTINTEILPVRAIRGVIPVIPVFVVHRQEIPVFEVELSATFCTDQAVDFQGLFPVIRGRGDTLL